MRTTLLILAFLLMPLASHAATLTLVSEPAQVGVGDRLSVKVLVDAKDAAVNAFSGTLTHSSNLNVESVSDANSIVNLWVTRPSGDPVSFAGLVPGGFAGDRGTLLTVVFRATEAGSATVALSDLQVLRNDGQGTPEPVLHRPLTLVVSSQSVGGYEAPVDTTPPEPFTIQKGQDPALFDNGPYVAFTTQDKGSGIDHYTVAETRLPFMKPKGEVMTSPYPIKDQYGTSDIVVHAYDQAGNAQVSVFHREHLLRPYEMLVLGSILIVVLLWLFYHYRRRA